MVNWTGARVVGGWASEDWPIESRRVEGGRVARGITRVWPGKWNVSITVCGIRSRIESARIGGGTREIVSKQFEKNLRKKW